MNAWALVASWAEDRAKLWRHDAEKAANAYMTNPMAEACNAYAIALGKCAAIIDREAKVFRAKAAQVSGADAKEKQ